MVLEYHFCRHGSKTHLVQRAFLFSTDLVITLLNVIGRMYFHTEAITIDRWCFCLQCQLQYFPYREINELCVATNVNREGWALQEGFAHREWALICLRIDCNWGDISKPSLVSSSSVELVWFFWIAIICSFGGWAIYLRPLALRPLLTKSLPFSRTSVLLFLFGKMNSEYLFWPLSFFFGFYSEKESWDNCLWDLSYGISRCYFALSLLFNCVAVRCLFSFWCFHVIAITV